MVNCALSSAGGIIYHHADEVLRVLTKEKVRNILRKESSSGRTSRLSDADMVLEQISTLFFFSLKSKAIHSFIHLS